MDIFKKINILCISEDKELQKEIHNSLILFCNGIDFVPYIEDGLNKYKQNIQNYYYDVVIIDIKVDCYDTKLCIQEIRALHQEQEILAIFDSQKTSLIEYINLGVKEYFFKYIADINPKRSLDALTKKVKERTESVLTFEYDTLTAMDDILHTEEIILNFDAEK